MGGLLFDILNYVINKKGGFLRKSATTTSYLKKRKILQFRSIFKKLSRVPLFHNLSPEKRPLGIPIIRDRVVQMAAKLVLEPIFEPNFLKCSYGFRPKRSAHDAVATIARTITFKRQTVV